MVESHSTVTLLLVGGTAVVSFGLFVLALQARRRTGNRKLGYVAAAFLAFCVKSLVTAYALLEDPNHPSSYLSHGHLEFLGSAFDLVIVGLLVTPFLRRS
ncbi:MAG: hypothetical protein QOD77_2140 [Thermoplasmata archaeon]|jgi:hypothetical protein|nr:hypothetical protein [Thermoplasmata archaeon]